MNDSLWTARLQHANDMTATVAIAALVIVLMIVGAGIVGERGRPR